jgi:UDP-N-acetylglucosamine--N-acetylmuramyl-(pentapeptide) pyrophosphoryl-undecaprenol N-acetylglucosamine transferase
MKKIVLTGGGTAGHVTPHFALLTYFEKENIDVVYVGSKNGIEKQLVTALGIPYYGISSGKLRRYFDKKNFTDPFRILAGFFQSIKHLSKIKPDLVFSKGGFVSVPVVMAAWLLGIPVVIHESDMTPGLANKLSQAFSKKILVTFEETLEHLPKKKGIYTGSPVRETLKDGDPEQGFAFTGFNNQKPVLMMMGGSIGSVKINTVLRESLPKLLSKFQIIHLCGKDNLDESLIGLEGYQQYEFVSKELRDLFAISDFMLSRAGSNAINEFLYLGIPSLLIPLSKSASRGDQILNANAFAKKGFSLVLEEEHLNSQNLINALYQLEENQATYKEAIKKSNTQSGSAKVFQALSSLL